MTFRSRLIISFVTKKRKMNKYLLLLGFLSLAFFAQAQDKEHFQLIQNEQQWAENVVQLRGDTKARGFDVTHQDLHLNIDPAVRAISGSVTTSFLVTQPSLTELLLDLEDSMHVDNVVYHGTANAFTHEQGKLTIPFSTPLPEGTLDKVTITYHGIPRKDPNGFGSFEQGAHSQTDTTPILWTLSEPYGADDWWPCKQDLTDKIDSVDITVTVPEGNKVGSNGLLVSEETVAGKTTFHWKHRYPIPSYLVAFATTNYVAYTDTVTSDSGDIVMLNYAYPESLQAAKAGTADLIPVMQLYNDLYGVYPFWKEKYGHAQFGWGGGMEHTTMTFCVYYDIGLLAHELAHQWFGDDATCGSWEDIWLNEGFATYNEGLIYEHGLGGQNFHNWLDYKINTVTSKPWGSVKVDDTTNVHRIFDWRLSYSKGAMVLHMLRWKIGDEAFFQGIRDYLNDDAVKYNFGRTAQLKAHLEETSGQDLTDFFDSWYSGEGYPIYTITWSQDTTNNVLRIQIKQTQSTTANYFKMPVPLRTVGASQNQDIVLQNDYDGQVFEVDLAEPITSLEFDPDLWLVAKDTIIHGAVPDANNSLSISAQLHLNPNPVQDVLHLSANDMAIESVEVYDLSGKLVLRSATPFSNTQDFDVTDLKSGSYILLARTKNTKGSIPFVKL